MTPFDLGNERPPERPKPPALRWTAVLVVLALIGAGLWYVLRARPPAPPPAPAPAPAPVAAAPQPPPAPAEPVPPREQTDAMVREIAGRLCKHPGLAAWLANDDLVRRFTTAVDNVARGESPRGQLSFMAPSGPFKVERKGREAWIDPRSFNRYDHEADVVAGLDAKGCAEAYAQLEPIVERTYGEIGAPGRSFDETLGRAIARLTAVPVPQGRIEVVQHVLFDYVDPALAGLTPAEQHLVRMGPRNQRLIQTKLRELAAALGVSDTAGAK